MAFLLALFTLFSPQTTEFSTPTTISGYPDSLVARSWNVEDGLPVNTVNSLIQDQQGYIWFTTYDGIVRFDGLNFKVFNHSTTPQIASNRATLIHEQKGTGLWIALENSGVVLMTEQDTTHFDEDDGFTSANIRIIEEGQDGSMWFGTNEGFFKYEEGSFSRVFERKLPAQNRIVSIHEDSDGSIWVSTHDGLVHVAQNDTTIYNRQPGTVHNEFTAIHRTQKGNLWLGTRTGLVVLKDGQFHEPDRFSVLDNEFVTAVYEDEKACLISTDQGLYVCNEEDDLENISTYNSQYKSFQHFYRDSKGTLWMVRNNGNVARLQGNKAIILKNPEELAKSHVNRITEDREGNIWLTTARNGIVQLRRSRVTVIGQQEGLSGNNILGLFEDSHGRFWVGTRDKGLNVIDGNTITRFREKGKITSDIVHSIAEDKQGNIWVAYFQRGVQKISDSGIQTYDLGFDAGVNDVHAIHVSADSTIWLGTYGGLVKFDPEHENHTVYTKADGLAGNLVRYIDEDRDGSLWIGTGDGGVSHFHNGEFTNYTVDEGLSSNNIRSVYVDEYDPETVWVGTEINGLNRIRGDSISSVGEQDGLPDHIIHYISQDKHGWLWMSSNTGVFRVNKEELNAFLDGTLSYFDMVHYGRESGMRNAECNGGFQQGGLRTSDGEFWFATQEGVAVFDRDSALQNSTRPEIQITDIFADGRHFTNQSIAFEAGVDDFQISFHALTFVTPEKSAFRYKLEGYDQNWHEVRDSRTVIYSDVPPGDYRFKVLGANNDGVWSADAATASIKVSPLFYQRTWFYLLIVLLLGVGYYGISKVRYRYLMRRQREMADIIDEQTAELRRERDEVKKQNQIIEQQARKLEQSNKAKDKFFSIIGHDLRNPFQALIGYCSYVLDDYESMDRDEIKESVEEIEDASQRLLNLVENLLNWASLQTEEVFPEPEWFSLDEVIKKNVELFSQSARQKGITIEVNNGESEQLYADRNMINTVIRNLISNAIKFTEEGGEVLVEVLSRGDQHNIKISDDGIGMPEEMTEDLMRLDQNTSRSGTNNETGTGLGLIICKEMTSLHNGDIIVDSEKGEGTTFTITIPRNAFGEEDTAK